MNLNRLLPKPTYRETAKYLDRVFEHLKAKHGSATSEEFEKELVAITGIGLRQIRTYKNNPKPWERLKDNSLVLPFVLEQRKKDKARTLRIWTTNLLLIAALFGAIGWLISRPKLIETFGIREFRFEKDLTDTVVDSKVFIQIPRHNWLLRVGPLKNSSIDRDKMACYPVLGKDVQNCTFDEADDTGSLQVTIVLDREMIRSLSISSTRPEEVEAITEQLRNLVDKSIGPSEKDMATREFKVGAEKVTVTTSPDLPNFRKMITTTVAL